MRRRSLLVANPPTVRPEQPADWQAILDVVGTAFDGREEEVRFVEAVRRSPGYIPELSLVAELAGRVVGYVLLSHIGLAEPPGTRVLALAPLAVAPDHQRRGIGSALMRSGIERADQSGESLVIVLGDPHYYRRFGFEAAERFAIDAPFRVVAGAFMVKPLRAYRRELRGLAIYPPTFAEVT